MLDHGWDRNVAINFRLRLQRPRAGNLDDYAHMMRLRRSPRIPPR